MSNDMKFNRGEYTDCDDFVKQMSGLQLSEYQLEAFLHSRGIPRKLLTYFNEELPMKFTSPVRHILDCGGGNGMYLDILLDLFSEAEGTLIDSAQFMLDQNKPHPRKRLLLENLADMSSLIDSKQKFDLICFSDVLHHCIVPSYTGTRELQTTILKNAAKLLAPNGRILVSERIFDSWITDEYSTYLTYVLTRSRLLSGVTRLLGANTAGVGVCFVSQKRFQKLCENAGLVIVEEVRLNNKKCSSEKIDKNKGALKRCLKVLVRSIGLGVKSIRHDLFLLQNDPLG